MNDRDLKAYSVSTEAAAEAKRKILLQATDLFGANGGKMQFVSTSTRDGIELTLKFPNPKTLPVGGGVDEFERLLVGINDPVG